MKVTSVKVWRDGSNSFSCTQHYHYCYRVFMDLTDKYLNNVNTFSFLTNYSDVSCIIVTTSKTKAFGLKT